MGRPVGSREIDMSQILTIVKMSKEDELRPEIADEADVAKRTVWRYQRAFELV